MDYGNVKSRLGDESSDKREQDTVSELPKFDRQEIQNFDSPRKQKRP